MPVGAAVRQQPTPQPNSFGPGEPSSGFNNFVETKMPTVLNNVLADQGLGASKGSGKAETFSNPNPSTPSTGNPLTGIEQFGTGLLPILGSIGGSIAGGALGTSADLVSGPLGTIGGGVIGAGVGGAFGRGLESYLRQQVFHISTGKSLGTNAANALKTGATLAPFGAFAGLEGLTGAGETAATAGSDAVESTMQASDQAASSLTNKGAYAVLKSVGIAGGMGAAANVASGFISDGVNGKLPSETIPSLASQGLQNAIWGGAFAAGTQGLGETISYVVGDHSPVTVDDLIQNAEKTAADVRASITNIVNTNLQQAKSDVSPEIESNLFHAPSTGNDILDQQVSKQIDTAKASMAGPSNVDILNKYNTFDPAGFGKNGEGVQNTLNNLTRDVYDTNGNIIKQSTQTRIGSRIDQLASNVKLSSEDVNNALEDTKLPKQTPTMDELQQNPTIANYAKFKATEQPAQVNTAADKINGVINYTKNAIQSLRSANDSEASVAADSLDKALTSIKDSGLTGNEDSYTGQEVLKLQRAMGKIAFKNDVFGVKNSQDVSSALGLAKSAALSVYSGLSDLLSNSIREQSGEDALNEFKTLNGDYAATVRAQDGLSRLANKSGETLVNLADKYSAKRILSNAADEVIKNEDSITGEKLANQIKDAAEKGGPNLVKKTLLRTVFAPLGFISDIFKAVGGVLGVVKGGDPSQLAELFGQGVDEGSDFNYLSMGVKNAGLSPTDVSAARAADSAMKGANSLTSRIARGATTNPVLKNAFLQGITSSAPKG